MQAKHPNLVSTWNKVRLRSVSDSEIYVEGFRAIRTDRNRNGGGISIYMKENILFNIKHDFTFDGLELMCVVICIHKHKPFLIVYWYRPPNSQSAVFDLLDSVLQPIESLSKDFILLGDLNFDIVKQPPSYQTKRLFSLVEEYDLKQLVEKPTRVTQTSSTQWLMFYTPQIIKRSLSVMSFHFMHEWSLHDNLLLGKAKISHCLS